MIERMVIIFLIYSLSFSGFAVSSIQSLKIEEVNKDNLLLQEAKLHIVKGDINRAGLFLRKIFGKDKKVAIIKKYYEALIDFIQGDYNNSYIKLDDGRFRAKRSYYRQICLLQLFNMMAVGAGKKKIKNHFGKCGDETQDYSKNRQMWIKSLVDIHVKQKYQRTTLRLGDHLYALDDYDVLKTWMKMALYLEEEQTVLDGSLIFPDDIYLSKSVREILGLAYYRKGDYEKAYSFVEDINTANAHNIKGGVAIAQKKYQKAMDFFKMALEKKYNSINAYSRLIPLSWFLKKWEDGLYYTDLLISKLIDPKEVLALKTAFLIRLDRPDEIRRNLNQLQNIYEGRLPLDVEMMNAYGHVLKGNKRAALESTDILCKKLNGLACYIHLQLNIWPDIGKTLDREDKIYEDKTLSLDSLRKNPKAEPLTEKIYINQKDIDELDSLEQLLIDSAPI
ncbi:MAG: hypothetical protein OXB84_01570 [Halobacteriovoraceae bacterium]|nr:hypothetical protein [Halobacteriovoraceae bacterium]